MKSAQSLPADIDRYIVGFSDPVRDILTEIRRAIRSAAPQAQERISYRIPTFALEGNLVHFAAFKKHIGFFPTASGVANFKKELAAYNGAKGSVQFPLDKPIPLGLIKKIVKFRVKENLERAKAKKKNKAKKTKKAG